MVLNPSCTDLKSILLTDGHGFFLNAGFRICSCYLFISYNFKAKKVMMLFKFK
jgi:hypothetical protein